MTRDKLDEILEKHIKWLREDPAGERANMSGADMSGANMSGAGIDYTSFTLWCGSLGILIDDAITSQLLYHVLSCVEVSPDVSDEVKKYF